MKKLWCILISVVILTSLVPASVFANEEFRYEIFTYTVHGNSVTITDCDTEASGDIGIPYDINGIPVEGIGPFAFSGCDKITGISFNGIKTIQMGAFAGCTALEKITFYDTIETIQGGLVSQHVTGQNSDAYFMGAAMATFYGCENLRNVYFWGDNIKIEGPLFIDCPNLNYVRLPENLSKPLSEYEFLGTQTVGQQKYVFTDYPPDLKIGKTDNEIIKSFCTDKGFKLAEGYSKNGVECYDEFQWCNGFAYIVLDEAEKNAMLVEYDETVIVGDELSIPEQLDGYKIVAFADQIFWGAEFKKCDLSSFPKLSDQMFREAAIESVVLSDETKEIPTLCFYGCPLEAIELPEGLESIEDYAFDGCEKIEEFIVPSTVKSLGDQVLAACPSLKKVEFKNGALTAIDIGGGGTMFTGGVSFMTENLETLIIPENITYIAYGEFMVTEAGRHGFYSVKYPDNLTVYGKKGTYAETYAAEHSLQFAAQEEQPIAPVYPWEEENGVYSYFYDGVHHLIDDTAKWEQGFCYKPLDSAENSAIIIGYDRAVIYGDELVIPKVIGGYTVVGFAERIFQNAKFKSCDLTDFPDLSPYMFQYAEIETVTLSEHTTEIPSCCFESTNIKKITLPKALTEIGFGAFRACPLEKLRIPSKVERIGDYAFEKCDTLIEIEFKEGALTQIGVGEHLSFEWCFSTKNLKNLILPESITAIGDCEFQEAQYGKTGSFPIKYPENLTVYGMTGSYAEEWASDKGLSFVDAESVISEYTESSVYHVEKIIPTEYGTILYFWPIGAPHGGRSPNLTLITPSGNKYNLSEPVSREDLWNHPEHENILLSEDGKTVTFSVSFDERSEGSVAGGETFVLHDAGTYYYKADLETGTCIETKFEPLDTIGEDVLSAWAKPEAKKAIELGFVPIAMRGNYKRNITRREFAEMAMHFLSVQYGYQPEHVIRTYYNLDKEFPMQDFVSAYCSSKSNRTGTDWFRYGDAGGVWEYEYKRSDDPRLVYSAHPFTDVDESSTENHLIGLAYNFGIINGISETEFNPDGEITRQEAAAMLMRVYRNYAYFQDADIENAFADDAQIADWAKTDVYNVKALAIMQGVGENTFSPLEHYTVEQAIATFLRLYESAPVSRKNRNINPLLAYAFEKDNFYVNIPGTTWFEKEQELSYESFAVMTGTQWRLHGRGDNKIFIVYKYGGIRDLTSYVPVAQENTSPIENVTVNADESAVSFVTSISDTFRLYNQLCGAEKVYGIGKYRFEIDVETGNINGLERMN